LVAYWHSNVWTFDTIIRRVPMATTEIREIGTTRRRSEEDMFLCGFEFF
jgi:hypothetical protein